MPAAQNERKEQETHNTHGIRPLQQCTLLASQRLKTKSSLHKLHSSLGRVCLMTSLTAHGQQNSMGVFYLTVPALDSLISSLLWHIDRTPQDTGNKCQKPLQTSRHDWGPVQVVNCFGSKAAHNQRRHNRIQHTSLKTRGVIVQEIEIDQVGKSSHWCNGIEEQRRDGPPYLKERPQNTNQHLPYPFHIHRTKLLVLQKYNCHFPFHDDSMSHYKHQLTHSIPEHQQ